MTAPIRVGEDPLDALLSIKKQRTGSLTPGSDPLDELMASKPKNDIHEEFRSGRLANRMERENTNEREAVEAEEPSYAQKALGGIASMARDIPGAEALQAGARSLVRGQTYREARDDIRSAEDAAPTAVRVGNRLIGGTLAAVASPVKGAASSGATYGVADALLQSDADKGVGDRLKDSAVEGTVGAVVGKAADAGANLIRAAASKSLGQQDLLRKAAMQAKDKINYGQAAREARQAGGTGGLLRSVLGSSDIAPYVQLVKNTRQFAGADDATIAREVYKQMTKQQGGLARRLAENGYDAATQLEHDNIGLAKDELKRAASSVMPSFDKAVAEHAAAAGERDAMRSGADAAKRSIVGTKVAGKNLGTKSPEAFNQRIGQMSADEAEAALNGVLGRTNEYTTLSANPVKLFGVPKSIGAANAVSPMIRALEQQMGGAPLPVDLIRALVASQGHPELGGEPTGAGGSPQFPQASRTAHPSSDLFADPASAAEAKKLLNSSFADSMYAISGKPAHVASQSLGPGQLGVYDTGRDSIGIAPWTFRGSERPYADPVGSPPSPTPQNDGFTSPERTFSHEIGHRLLWRGELAHTLGYRDAQPGAGKLAERLRRTADSVRASGGTIPGYAGTNDTEHGAEAVANAVHFLRLTDQQRASPELPSRVAQLRQQFEQTVPGTGAALEYLLALPIYRHHPLTISQGIRPTRPDATSANGQTRQGGALPVSLTP